MRGIAPNRLEQALASAFHRYDEKMRAGHMEAAMDCMEWASALALTAYSRDLRQMGIPRSAEELADELCCRILPHRNRGSLKSRRAELATQFQNVLEKASAPGVHSKEETQALAGSWLELAVSFAKVSVKYEADLMRQQQRQSETVPKHEIAMTM